MRSLRQLLRQPGKSLVGFLLVALAIAILITCVGQFTATSLTRANMDDHYSTLALISNDYLWERKPDNTGVRYYDTLPEEYQRWVDETIQARSDLFLQESYSGLLSAYIPALAPDNFSQYAGEPNAYFQRKQQYGAPYRGAMLEVTLTKPGNSLAEDYSYFSATWDGDETALRNSVTYVCLATVERTIALEEGFDPPVGKTILLTITAYCEEDIESMALEEGQRYLVYGMDFSNAHEASFSNLINNTHDAHPGLFQSWFGEVFYSNEGTLDPQTGNWKALLDAEEFAKQIHCTMTVCDYSSLPISTYIDGEFSFRADSRIFYSPNKTIGITVPAEEYVPKYQIPTIAKLTGTAEEFLASPEGALWRQALEEMDISNHSFPVLAVDKLGYQVAFNRGDARITQGRDFTEEERTEGKNVCILSETLANLNGLEIGDTLDLRYTYYDPNIHVQQDSILNNYG
ncbi:MAG TPA: ABC transporter permease, partial [Candidatus Faecousia intestinigallinarum]|nr:ABC transporter permease [Candidatus Faecousia intestinigallinarum]